MTDRHLLLWRGEDRHVTTSLPSGARAGPGTNRTIVLVRYLGDILEETVLTAVLTGVSCSSEMNAQV